jgi:hypothetical protein
MLDITYWQGSEVYGDWSGVEFEDEETARAAGWELTWEDGHLFGFNPHLHRREILDEGHWDPATLQHKDEGVWFQRARD